MKTQFKKILNQHPLFWFKTFLHGLAPNGYGYYRKLRKQKNQILVHNKELYPLLDKHNEAKGWLPKDSSNIDAPNYRAYANYQEYVDHQSIKLDELLTAGVFSNRVVVRYRLKFYRRFKHLPQYLSKTARIICLGARQGTEVEVLQDLGYRNSYGLDLNPGPENPYVRPGDFMNIMEEDASFDLIYCNAVDHAFNLPDFFTEHVRVLKPNGFALYDVATHQDQGGSFESVRWKNDREILLLMLQYFDKIIHIETDNQWRWILLQGTQSQ